MQFKSPKKPNFNQGYLLVLVLVMGAVFFTIITASVRGVVIQNQVVNFRLEQQKATEIAEAGLNYYKWYLAHYPDDVTNGTGAPGPYVHQYFDPEGDSIGEFSLNVASTTYCGQVATIDVTSVGHTYADDTAVSTLSGTYKRPTVAEYSFINNSAIWYGDSRVITGPVHGNQGVRMDGSHNSFVGSGQSTWTCDSSFGCSPDQTVDGVYTTGSNATPGLFTFPVSPVDFNGLTIDMAQMRTSAQSYGIYYGAASGSNYGYRVVFNGDGTIDIYEVTRTRNYWSYSSSEGWHRGERNDVREDALVASNVTIPVDCPVIFIEDKLWIEGDVSQKVSIAAGLNTANTQNNIVLHNYIDYVPGTDAGLLAIAEDDVDVGIEVQNDMAANGIFIAQDGRFGRNHYCDYDCSSESGSQSLPGALDSYVSRDSLNRLGSVISNLRGGTEWSSSGTHISGFRARVTSFDNDQVDNPPPLTPETSDVYIFEDWRQEG